MSVVKWNELEQYQGHMPFSVIVPVNSEHFIGIGLLPSEGLVHEAAQRNLEAWERRNQQRRDTESQWQERFSFSHLLRTTAGSLIELADQMEGNWARQAGRVNEGVDGQDDGAE